MVQELINYVLVVILTKDRKKVAYIKKLKGPKNLIGKYNFIGGKIETNELPLNACIREVKEEAGVDLPIESIFHISSHYFETYTLNIYTSYIDDCLFSKIRTIEEEPVFTNNVTLVKNEIAINPSLYDSWFENILNYAVNSKSDILTSSPP